MSKGMFLCHLVTKQACACDTNFAPVIQWWAIDFRQGKSWVWFPHRHTLEGMVVDWTVDMCAECDVPISYGPVALLNTCHLIVHPVPLNHVEVSKGICFHVILELSRHVSLLQCWAINIRWWKLWVRSHVHSLWWEWLLIEWLIMCTVWCPDTEQG